MSERVLELLALARTARARAHAPYSGYRVGAALRAVGGGQFAGCNVENVSYGLTVCAERCAVFGMVASGGREIAEVLVLTEDGGAPCGACLQVLLEFAPAPERVAVHLASSNGEVVTRTLGDLLPFGFRSERVART